MFIPISIDIAHHTSNGIFASVPLKRMVSVPFLLLLASGYWEVSMQFTPFLRTALTALSVGAAVILGAGSAQAIVWDLSGGVAPPGTPAGTSHNFTAGGITITAAGFTSNAFTTSATLFEKNGGVGETGLGLTNDPNVGQNEINGSNLIRIDFTNAKNAGVTNFDFQFGSSTAGESWLVFASNSSNSGFVQVASGNDELVHTIIGPV